VVLYGPWYDVRYGTERAAEIVRLGIALIVLGYVGITRDKRRTSRINS
jgi:hypothetical protein